MRRVLVLIVFCGVSLATIWSFSVLGYAAFLYGSTATAALYFVFTAMPIRVACSCRASVKANEPWVCQCGHVNTRTGLNSFLDKCERCSTIPQSLFCPWCSDDFIFLTKERIVTPYAHIAGKPSPTDAMRQMVDRERRAANELRARMLADVNANRAMESADRQWEFRKTVEQTAITEAKILALDAGERLQSRTQKRLHEKHGPLERQVDEYWNVLHKVGIVPLQAVRHIEAQIEGLPEFRHDIEMKDRVKVVLRQLLEKDL